MQQQVRQLQINRYELILVVLPWGTGHQSLRFRAAGDGAVVRRHLSGVRGRGRARPAEPEQRGPQADEIEVAIDLGTYLRDVVLRDYQQATDRTAQRDRSRAHMARIYEAIEDPHRAVATGRSAAGPDIPGGRAQHDDRQRRAAHHLHAVPGQRRTTGVDRKRHPDGLGGVHPVRGAWSDRIGRKRMLIIGNVIFLVSAILSGMTDSVQTLIPAGADRAGIGDGDAGGDGAHVR